jgi:hypothetical protein
MVSRGSVRIQAVSVKAGMNQVIVLDLPMYISPVGAGAAGAEILSNGPGRSNVVLPRIVVPLILSILVIGPVIPDAGIWGVIISRDIVLDLLV